jgi:hypothetical protein
VRSRLKFEIGLEAIAVGASAARSGLFLLALVICLGALGLHVWAVGLDPANSADFYRIDFDNSLSERFEFVMLISAAIMFAVTSLRRRKFALVFPSIICAYLAIDNSLQIHEPMGHIFYHEHAHAGELIFSGLCGLAILFSGLIVIRKADYFDRVALLSFAGAMLVFAFFAVGVDAAHAVVARFWPRYDLLLGSVEDFGEMLSIALLLAIAAQIFGPPSSRPLKRMSPAWGVGDRGHAH